MTSGCGSRRSRSDRAVVTELDAVSARPSLGRRPTPLIGSLSSPTLHRCGPPPRSRSIAECEPLLGRSLGGSLQRAVTQPTAPAAPDWDLVRRPLSRTGRPLERSIGAEMGRRFGRDFSQVRVHDDDAADAASRAVAAAAFTVGHHLVFGRGRYAPATADGERLLTHELTHVVQQAGHRIGSGALDIVSHDAPSEWEAGAWAAGRFDRSVGLPTTVRLQRSPLSDSVKALWAKDPMSTPCSPG